MSKYDTQIFKFGAATPYDKARRYVETEGYEVLVSTTNDTAKDLDPRMITQFKRDNDVPGQFAILGFREHRL